MSDLIAGADRSQWAANTYPGVDMGYIDKVLAHTTETPSWPGYNGNRYCPQVTIDPTRRAVRQHYPVTMSARSLEDRAGGVVTNRDNVFQYELVGYSDRSLARSIGRDDLWVGNWGDQQLGFIAEVLAQVVGANPVPWTLTPRFTRNPRYGLYAPQRMSFDEWRGFAGWTYHAACPENVHWDSGALDLPRVMWLARQLVSETPTSPTQTKRRTHMFLAHSQHNKDHWALVDGHSVRWLTASAFHNLRNMRDADGNAVVPTVANGAIMDETIRLIADTGTARGGVAEPGPDIYPRDYTK